jgi:hypothetical protein
MDVVSHDAKEVSEEAVSNKGNVAGENNFLLSGCLGVANSIISSHNIEVLVEESEVGGIPDGAESQRDDSQDQSSLE